MMQRILFQRTSRQMARVRSLLVDLAVSEPPLAVCCCLVRQPLGSQQHCLGTSASSMAVEQPKHCLPEEEQIQPKPQPHSQGGTTAKEDPSTNAEALPTTPQETIPQKTPELEIDPLLDKSISLVERFKKMLKQYSKVMIPVHLLTSSVWFGMFYYAAMKGVNLVPFLEFIGLPEKVVGLLKDSQSGYALTAYAMYKIATPARYTLTLGGTSYSVQYLRKHGYLSTPPPVKDYIQDKMEETREKLSEKMEETKERLSEKMEETKELLSERMEETKERFSGKMEESKDKFSERLQETKDKVSFRKKRD